MLLSIPIAYFSTMVWDFPIVAVWTALIVGNVVSAFVGYFWLHKTLNTFDFAEVEETVHQK